jgi:nucleoid DNA-binding protein
VTKKELAEAIADEMRLTHAQATEIVQRVFDRILETLVKEGRLELRNLGVFDVKEREPRTARNPRTGEKVQVPAKRVVTFKPWAGHGRSPLPVYHEDRGRHPGCPSFSVIADGPGGSPLVFEGKKASACDTPMSLTRS